MRIIKRGHYKTPTCEFHCETCGCVFVAEGKEIQVDYKYDYHMDDKHSLPTFQPTGLVSADCPKCGDSAKNTLGNVRGTKTQKFLNRFPIF